MGAILEKPNLPFHNLADRHQGLTQAVAEGYAEAARVCLDRHHTSPVDFEVKDDPIILTVSAEWTPTDTRTKDAWNNDTDTTEAGAYACVLAAVEVAHGLFALKRAETLTGADYYVCALDAGPNDFETSMRLEVSGVDKGGEASVKQRLREKMQQASTGISNLPAMAGVVGFRARLILLQEVGAK
jgi:hypothetical protein